MTEIVVTVRLPELDGAVPAVADFPDRLYVSLTAEGSAESLECAFEAEDLEDANAIAVYELKSVGRVERRFVEGTLVEQRREECIRLPESNPCP